MHSGDPHLTLFEVHSLMQFNQTPGLPVARPGSSPFAIR